jgi:hypothetical protein
LKRTKTPESLQKTREKIDNYVQTVYALWALISILTWDRAELQVRPDRRYSVGRRLNHQDGNRQVTPDLVVQFAHASGLVAEAKRTLPADRARWVEVVRQLQGYDVPLLGWWTPSATILRHDVAALMHQSLGPAFGDFISNQESQTPRPFRNPLAIIEFNLFEQTGQQRMFLCLRRGTVEPPETTQQLRDGVPVPMERVLSTYSNKQFYDSEPESEYLMAMIWSDIVIPASTNSRRDPETGRPIIDISVGAVTETLQRAYGSTGGSDREVEYPKRSWVATACTRFVRLKLARQVDSDNFRILYRSLRGDLIERFHGISEPHGSRRTKLPGSRRSRDSGTLPLFE